MQNQQNEELRSLSQEVQKKAGDKIQQFMIKKYQHSGLRGSIPQHNKDYILQTHS